MCFVYLAGLGILLSLYALWVEQHAKKKKHKAFCDISKYISCTKAFTHKYGTTFGVHNGFLGLAFYLSIMLVQDPIVLVSITTLALFKTFQLIYLSYWKMRNFCLVCTASYIVNIWLFIIALRVV